MDDWNFWQKDLNTGIFRDVYVNKIESFIETGMIVAITGARRSGKSFIMRQAAKKFYLSNITSPTTFNSLGKTFEISDETIEKFSGYLEEIYLMIFLKI